MTTPLLRVGHAIRAYGGTKPNRPGVVLRVHAIDGTWFAFIAFGTSQAPPDSSTPTPILIERGHPAFGPLGLDTPTWFKARAGAPLRDDDPSIRVVGECPPDMLIVLRGLFGFK